MGRNLPIRARARNRNRSFDSEASTRDHKTRVRGTSGDGITVAGRHAEFDYDCERDTRSHGVLSEETCGVGWVQRSGTHRSGPAAQAGGFRFAAPTLRFVFGRFS